ncbi:MAG TPA: gamma-glutamyltransferase [Pyrinomonadaceae bacterium]|nr:gamma-glutamyltransferase [Pyrinomonadaceae bacterium]
MQIRIRSFGFVAILAIVSVLAAIFPSATVYAAWPDPVRGKHAMVVSQHELASRIGVEILKKGGNAVDAAIAVGLALAVVYPEAGNIGGGGFMVIHDSKGGSYAIDYREMAPAAASRNVFVGPDGKLIKGEGSSTIGYRASGVPGTLAGFELAFKKYGSGKVKWSDLVEPARRLAANGYVLSYRLARLFRGYSDGLSKYSESKRIFLNNGKFFNEGDLFKQPDLAATLGRVERLGAREFYTGRTAQLIAADMKANNGLITLEDLKNYQAKEREPLVGDYRGYKLISMPPPSSGGIVLLEALNILEGYDVAKMQYNSAEKYHYLTEAMRRAFADRAEFMGDPDFADVPTEALISKSYAAKRRESIQKDNASNSKDVGHGEPTGRESMDTTNFAVVDKDGTMVVNTYTINDLYGSQVTAKGTGVLLNDEMDDFAARPGEPNMFGLIQGERNAVKGGKRPLSSMTPTIVLRPDGSVWFGVGARGGPRIISAVLQTVLNVIDHRMDIQAAIDAPRIHHQWLPDTLTTEPVGFSPDTTAILKAYGHRLAAPSWVASATGLMIDEKGVRLGAIDSRGDGLAVGY